MHRPAIVLAAASMIALLSGGCEDGCNRKPYVPFSIDSAPTQSSTMATQPSVPRDGGAVAPSPKPMTDAVLAPPGQSEWVLDGLALRAPSGTHFLVGTVADFDGDGQKDAFALVRGKEERAPSLLFFQGRSPGVVAAPSTLELDKELGELSCTGERRIVYALHKIGAGSVLSESGVTCAGGEGRRMVVAVKPDRGIKVRFAALVVDRPTDPKLTIAGAASDLDGDKVEDLELTVTLEGGAVGGEPKVSLPFRFLDRPAGLGLDRAVTDTAYVTLASQALARASRPKDATSALASLRQVRNLAKATCREWAGRIEVKRGTAFVCPSPRILEDLLAGEVRAHTTLGDVLSAMAAYDRPGRPPLSKARAAEMRAWIGVLAPLHRAGPLRDVRAVPDAAGGSVTFGPLAFDSGGKLLVRTQAGVVRVDPATSAEQQAEGVASWASAVSREGVRVLGAEDPCTGQSLGLRLSVGDGGASTIELPIASRVACAKGPEPVPVVPLASSDRGLDLLVGGLPMRLLPGMARAIALGYADFASGQPGSALSESGKRLIVPTSLGILVRSEKSVLYQIADLEAPLSAQRHCAVSNDGGVIACVGQGRAWLADTRGEAPKGDRKPER